MKIFSIESRLMQFLDKLFCAVVINILFLLFSLPVVTLGASSAALYRCFLTMSEDSGPGPFRLFWRSFRTNFKKATLLELCVLPVFAIVVWELLTFLSGSVGAENTTSVMFILPTILVTAWVSYVFPLQAQFENSVGRTLKNAALLAVRHLPATVAVTALNLVFPALFFFFPDILIKTGMIWFFIGFSAVASVNVRILKRVFKRYIPGKEGT